MGFEKTCKIERRELEDVHKRVDVLEPRLALERSGTSQRTHAASLLGVYILLLVTEHHRSISAARLTIVRLT